MDQKILTLSPEIDNASTEKPSLPLVNISVTADIRFSHYHDSITSDDTKDSKVSISKNHYKIFYEEQNHETDMCIKSKSKSLPIVRLSHSEEFDVQPIVRRSRKSTQLNCSVQDKNHIENKRDIITRTVLLPYIGCSKKDGLRKTFDKNTILVKSYKSWEKVTKSSNTLKKETLFRSKSLRKSPTIEAVLQHSDNKIFEDLLSYPFSKSNSQALNYNTAKQPVMRRFHVEDLKSGSQILFDDQTKIRYLCTPIINNIQNSHTDRSSMAHPKFITTKNNLFGEEMLKPYKLSPKSTRNVSILHRPRTRNQATSTSSLNILYNYSQGLEHSNKGMDKPFIANEKAFPSELTLKLVPKKEVLEKNKENEDSTKNDQKHKSTHSSEADLLAPMLTTQSKHNKRKGSRFFSCFSKSKKKKVDEDNNLLNGSDEHLSKEVYYPSAVEVHHKK